METQTATATQRQTSSENAKDQFIRKTRELSPVTRIEILTPDFRGRMDRALDILKAAPPDVMNHNLETIPRLYKEARPGSDYAFSLDLLRRFKTAVPRISSTASGACASCRRPRASRS